MSTRATLPESVITHLVDEVQALDPQPRRSRWTSATLCVVDAVFSLGARYFGVVVPLVERVGRDFGLEPAACAQPATALPGADPIPLDAFLHRVQDVDELVAVTNRQRSSTRNGILKAEAAIRYAEILSSNGVRTLTDAQSLLEDGATLDAVESELKKVPGEGGFGIRRGYLWMLVGADDVVKPDRMVLRWLKGRGATVSPDQARDLLAEIAARLDPLQSGRRPTLWEVDHAIWLASRRR